MTDKEREEAITTIKRIDRDFGDYEPNHKVFKNILSALKGFEGMTNGEVIQALFPEVKVEINGFLVRCVFIEHEFTTLLEWWDAPYKAESEVKGGRD